jgi:hypothetical protein
MTEALTEIRTAPGLDPYLDAIETRLERAVETYSGVVAAVGKESLAAGGKRLRPALVFLSAAEDAEQPLAAGVAVELLHMATLVHDDLIDGAEVRRGHASVWSAHGVDVARATGDYLFARAFASPRPALWSARVRSRSGMPHERARRSTERTAGSSMRWSPPCWNASRKPGRPAGSKLASW